MNLDVIENRLQDYAPKTKQEEINALKEICQEIALSGLARSEFFQIGAFQGGTCLRILYGLERFSEDLDFILQKPPELFEWSDYLKGVEQEFNSFGLDLEVMSRSNADATVKRAFLKQNSFGKVLNLSHKSLRSDKQSIKIKLEIDVNPPVGSTYETHYLDFPYPFSVLAQDPSSLFASKCHALLCRPFVKGRDWFDFLWYVKRKVVVNFLHLKEALFQFGPYKEQAIDVDKSWLVDALSEKIKSISWADAKLDVEIFLKSADKKFVESWSVNLFLSVLKKL